MKFVTNDTLLKRFRRVFFDIFVVLEKLILWNIFYQHLLFCHL